MLSWVAGVGVRGLQEKWLSSLYDPQPQGGEQELEGGGPSPTFAASLKALCSVLSLSYLKAVSMRAEGTSLGRASSLGQTRVKCASVR